MANWLTPKQNWAAADIVGPTDLNRIEGNIQALVDGIGIARTGPATSVGFLYLFEYPVIGAIEINTSYNWITVGRTGSGCKLIWPALDKVPIDAKAMKVWLSVSASIIGTDNYISSAIANAGLSVRRAGSSIDNGQLVSAGASLNVPEGESGTFDTPLINGCFELRSSYNCSSYGSLTASVSASLALCGYYL